jgi:hypothetical protein
MKIRNNNPLDLQGQNGEQIAVKVAASGTVFAVTYDLNGTASSLPQPFSFTLSSANNPTILVLFFVFSNNSGGVYKITVTGKPGEDTSHYTVAQFADEAANAIAFTFDIV